jgi:hypothetical protein
MHSGRIIDPGAGAALDEMNDLSVRSEQFTQGLGQPWTKRGNYPIALSLSFVFQTGFANVKRPRRGKGITP